LRAEGRNIKSRKGPLEFMVKVALESQQVLSHCPCMFLSLATLRAAGQAMHDGHGIRARRAMPSHPRSSLPREWGAAMYGRIATTPFESVCLSRGGQVDGRACTREASVHVDAKICGVYVPSKCDLMGDKAAASP